MELLHLKKAFDGGVLNFEFNFQISSKFLLIFVIYLVAVFSSKHCFDDGFVGRWEHFVNLIDILKLEG